MINMLHGCYIPDAAHISLIFTYLNHLSSRCRNIIVKEFNLNYTVYINGCFRHIPKYLPRLHDITEILLKVALNTITPNLHIQFNYTVYIDTNTNVFPPSSAHSFIIWERYLVHFNSHLKCRRFCTYILSDEILSEKGQ